MAVNIIAWLLAMLGRGADEALMPLLDGVAKRFAHWVPKIPMVAGIVRMINPAFLQAARQAGPTVVAGAIGTALPDSLFKTPQLAALVKGTLVRFITELADALPSDPNAPIDGAVVQQAADNVFNEEYVYAAQTDLVHVTGCPKIKGGRSKVTMAMILENEFAVASCCFPQMQNRLNKPAETSAAKATGPIRGIADVIDQLESDVNKGLVLSWYDGLTDEEQVEVSVNLDLASEGALLVLGIKQGMSSAGLLRLIKNQSSRAAVAHDLKKVVDYGHDKAQEAATPLAEALESAQVSIDNRIQNPPAKPKFFSREGLTELWRALWEI